jgi:hypothetical protein
MTSRFSDIGHFAPFRCTAEFDRDIADSGKSARQTYGFVGQRAMDRPEFQFCFYCALSTPGEPAQL